ncbi:MAG: fructokinase [Chloroflexi bacterium]|nr:MAG: fructokinase [Phototrophicales bacterium]RMF82835.1 MAG: fructokinase [Chloroflexota bacterium]
MSVVSFGELLIDFVALESGVTVGEASGFQKAPGGAPANVAVAVKRLGHDCAFITQVGDDPFGHFLVGVLQADDIDTRGVSFSTEARTALAFVSLAEAGERSFVFYRHPSADMLMRPEDVVIDVIDSRQIFHFGSITMIDEPVRSATLYAVQYARDNGKLISYDPNLRLALWPSADAAREGMLRGFEYAHFVKVSDDEVEFLTGADDPTPLWRDNIKLLVVTHGAGGATVYTPDGQSMTVHGFKVEPVDTTGAGDGFVAGFLSGILTHLEDYTDHLESITRFANAVGAMTTTQRGAIPALPTRAQVDAFLSQNP